MNRSNNNHQQHKNNDKDSGLFSSLKSMANDLIGNSAPSSHNNHHHHHQQQQVKRSIVPNNSTTTTPQIATTTNNNNKNNNKTQTLFPSYQTLQTTLPQEIERVTSVLQNPNATLSQLEQGDYALDDLVVLLSSQLAQLAELKRENSKKLISKLKSTTTTPSNNVVAVSPTTTTKSPTTATTTSSNTSVNTSNVKTQSPIVENKGGFGALANRSSNNKPNTPTIGASSNKSATVNNTLESVLDWQENDVVTTSAVVEPPKPQVKEQELFSMDSFDDTFTHEAPPLVSASVTTSSTTVDNHDDILGFEIAKPSKEEAFLDELLGTEKSGNQGGVMFDFSDEGQKMYQSNQILSMFDKPAETTASILDDIPPVATTTPVSSVDEFDF